MKNWFLFLVTLQMLSSCRREQNPGSVQFQSNSARVVMNYDEMFEGDHEATLGPHGIISIQVCNETSEDVIWYPERLLGILNENSTAWFELVVDRDTLMLTGYGWIKVPKDSCVERYDVMLSFSAFGEKEKSDPIDDSTSIKERLTTALETGALFMRDRKSGKAIPIPKKSDFNVVDNWGKFPIEKLRKLQSGGK